MSGLRTLPEALAEAARSDAGYWFVSNGRDVFRSYTEVRNRSLGAARALAERGVARGDLVAIVLADPEPFLTTLFGASLAGAIPASLYPPATTGELSRYVDLTAGILRAAAARVVVTSAPLASAFDTIRAQCPELAIVLVADDLDRAPADPALLPVLDDIAFVQFTSGSTSTPKGVALSHRNVCANVDAINGPAGLGTTSHDVGVSWLPLNHDMGLVGMALGPLYSSRPGVLMTPQVFAKRPADWLRAISRFRGTVSFAPNFAYDLCVRRVRDRDLDGIDLSCWRVAGCGAEPIHPPTLAAFAEKFAAVGFREASFLPSYGLAEHVLAATLPRRGQCPRVETVSSSALTDSGIAVRDEGSAAVSLISCGVPLPEHRLDIVAEDGRRLSERHVGEIVLAGPSVMLGYYKRGDLTAQTIRDGWLHTGDLGYISNGELFVCGRVKDIVIVNGRKYHPQDLEWAVDDLSGVRRGRVAAFAVAEPGRADRVVIVVEPSGTVAAEALADAIRRRIGDLFGLYIDDVVVVPAGTIGRTTSGKVQRAATRERYARGELMALTPR